jgi:hypothetical protein
MAQVVNFALQVQSTEFKHQYQKTKKKKITIS